MGNLKVKYRASKGVTDDAGEEIHNPEDFLKTVLGSRSDWEKTKDLYDQRDASQQRALLNTLGGDVMSNFAVCQQWYGELTHAQKMEKVDAIKKWMAE